MSLTQMNLMQMSFYGAVMSLAVILIRAFAINKLPKRVFVLLWKIVLLRLLIPFSIPSVLSAYSIVERNQSVQDAVAEIPTAAVVTQVVEETLSAEAVTAVSGGTAAVPVRFVLWMAGVTVCAAFFIIAYLRCYLEFRTSLPVSNAFAAKWMEEHRLKRSIRIRQSDQISAPLTYGIFKPVILMPKKTDWENDRQLQYVLLHEYIHIRRFDMLWKLIAALALCIHWFNPLVWVLYLLFNRDIELSCDEGVVRQFGENAKAAYARTLITMEEKKSGLMPLCNNFSRNAIEERITAIMKIKKVTIGVLVVSAVIPVVIVILFATSVKKEAMSDAAGETTEVITAEGSIAEGIEVPDAVLEAAKQLTAQRYADRQDEGWRDWRIESLAYTYTYNDFEKMTLQIYCLNYEFLADAPESVTLAGGMTMDENGWVAPEYADSTYLVFRQEGETLSWLTTLMENDCFPGDEIFTDDLRQRLESESNLQENQTDNIAGAEAAGNVRENTGIIQCVMEGMLEEMPATLYAGDGFSIYIPDDGWLIYDETLEDPVLMTAVYASDISVWVEHYAEKPSEVREHLLAGGYADSTDGGKLQRLEDIYLMEVRIVGLENETWVIGSMYPQAYEWGARLDAIAGTFAITVNEAENMEAESDSLKNSAEAVVRHIMVSFYTAYFAGDTEGMKQYLAESFVGEAEGYENPEIAGEIEVMEIKGTENITNEVGDKCTLSLEFRLPSEDSLTYLTVMFIRENTGWKIRSYGLEK